MCSPVSCLAITIVMAVSTIDAPTGGPSQQTGPTTVSQPVRPTVRPSLGELARQSQDGKQQVDPERETLQAYLSKYDNADLATLSRVKCDELSALLPKSSFFSLWFPQYPVAVEPSAPLKPTNVFVVTGEEVAHLRSAADIGKHLQDCLGPVRDEATVRQAAVALLILFQELKQDGFFEFARPKITLESNGEGMNALGEVEVVEKRGDKGRLTVRISCADGRIDTVKLNGQLSPGIRPRCQATRLLDPDPVIREIMRRDLIVMGSRAEHYLVAQWRKAGPRLKKELEKIWRQIVAEGR